jgi:hypothetical protein
MSEDCAGSRGTRWCRGERPRLTVTGGVLGFQWRHGGSVSRQPSGGSG